MKKIQYGLLLHPLFLLSLLLLLLNDVVFKYQFHNWWTGKISDFAGLLACTIFFIAFFPASRLKVIISIALFFTWWKSPLSESLLHFFNSCLNIPFTRVVDYSDLLALAILPAALFIHPARLQDTALQKLSAYCIGFISFILFTATSLPRRLTDNNRIKLDKYVKTKKKEDAIIKKLQEHGLNPVKRDIYEKVYDNDYYLKSKDTSLKMMRADSLHAGVYRKITYGSPYTIPKLYAGGDSITNLQLLITEFNGTKREIRLHSFEHKTINQDSSYYGQSFFLWKKLKRPIRKKIKEILNH